MTYARIFRAALLGALLLQGVAFGADRSLKVYNRLRVMYDDNIYERDQDKTESWIISEEPEFLLDLNLSRTFVGLRYRPSFVYWENRESDDTDIHHDLDVDVTHNFTPRLALALKDTFRIAQQPEQIDRGTTLREQEDYTYNVADGVISYLLDPNTRVEGSGRYTLLRYDQNDVADREDYDIYAAGATLRRQVTPTLAVGGDYRYEDTAYTDADNRDAQSHFVGLSLENVFGAALSGSLRGGYQYKTFDAEGVDSRSAPYVDGQLTLAITPATRLSAGAGYALTEAGVYPYVNQDRVNSFVSLAHDFTARLSAYASASYSVGDYDNSETVVPGDFPDGSEDYAQFSARASYKIGRRNWLEAGWSYVNLDSDLRENFDRNRFDIGWRTEI
jgi:hypothetical protein